MFYVNDIKTALKNLFDHIYNHMSGKESLFSSFVVFVFLALGSALKLYRCFGSHHVFYLKYFFLLIHVDIWRGILARSLRVTENMSLLPWIIYSGLMEKKLKNLRGFSQNRFGFYSIPFCTYKNTHINVLKIYISVFNFKKHPGSRASFNFVFLIKEEKRRLCLNYIKPLRSPQPKLLDQSILFSLVKLVFFSASIHLLINRWS